MATLNTENFNTIAILIDSLSQENSMFLIRVIHLQAD